MLDNNSVMSFMDFVIVAAGVYMLYGWYLLVMKGEIKEGIMVSKTTLSRKCKDIEGFKKEMGPRSLIFAIAAIASGSVGLINDYVVTIPPVLYWILYALFFAAIVWFGICTKKLEKKYF